jgi:hypothetical protein
MDDLEKKGADKTIIFFGILFICYAIYLEFKDSQIIFSFILLITGIVISLKGYLTNKKVTTKIKLINWIINALAIMSGTSLIILIIVFVAAGYIFINYILSGLVS